MFCTLLRYFIIFMLFQMLNGCGSGKNQSSQLGSQENTAAGQPYVHPEPKAKILGSVPISVEATDLGYAGALFQIDTLPVGNGFAPKLSLAYSSSQTEAALAGVGWNLVGVSSISRCASQKVFDGIDKAIDWTGSDSFCLDGKKLLQINDGEFRLYTDEQKKIIKNADGHFEVFTKAGQHLFFGSNASSREDGLNGTFFSYFLDRIVDKSGNSIEFRYEKQGGRLFISSILYGGNDYFSRPHYRNISFFYQSSAISTKRFIAGQKFEADRLLKEIKISGVDGDGWSYRLHHEKKGPAGLPLLTAVDQCFKDLTCFSKTTLEYELTQDIQLNDAPAYLWTSYAPKKFPKWANDQSARAFVDLNNDGYLDLIALRKDGISYSLSGPNGPGPVVEETRSDLIKWSPLVDMFAVADMNRDGYNDIVLFTQYGNSPGIYVAYWNGKSFDPLAQVSKAFGDGWSIRNNVRAVVDANNDGWPDVVGIRKEGVFVALSDQHGALVGGEQVLAPYYKINDGWVNSSAPRYFVDINGDGLIDIVGFGEKNVEVALGNGTNFLPPQVWSTEFSLSKYNPNTMIRQLADMNSDGLLDIVAMGMDGVNVALNTGKGFGPSERWLNNLGLNQGWDFQLKERFIFDVNQDGIVDFVGFKNTGAEIYLGTGKPNIDQRPIKTNRFSDLIFSWDNKKDRMQIDDLDGNGKTDFFASLSDGIWKAEFNTTAARLLAVKTAMGEETRISYSSLIDPSVYKRSKDQARDLIPVTGSLPIVSSIKKSNGVGGFFNVRYSYENAFAHRDFLGFLGFEKRTTFDDAAGTETVDTYSQDVSRWTQGALLSHEIYSMKSGRKLVSSTVSNFESPTLGLSPLHRTILEKSTESKFYDELGKFSYSVATKKEYDDFQNTTLVETTTTDANGTYVTRIDSEFTNETDNWLIGLVHSVKNTMSASGSKEKIIKKSVFEYDNSGQLTSETEEPDSSLWIKKQYQRTHNNYGLVDTVITSWGPGQGKGLAFTSTKGAITFDGRGFPEQMQNALSHVTSQSIYPDTGLVKNSIDPNGLSTSYLYDAANRLSSVQEPSGRTIAIDRLACDSSCPTNAIMIERKSSQGFGQTLSYIDSLGRTIRTTKDLTKDRQVAQDTIYDGNGHMVKSSKPYFLGEGAKDWTLFAYDERNRLRLTNLPDNTTKETRYDGLRTTSIDALGHKTIVEKDGRGFLKAVTNEKNETLNYVYDPAGNILEIHAPGDQVTYMGYDIFGRRTNLTDPTAGVTTTAYNALGLPANVTRQGIGTESFYDELGRPLKKTTTLTGSATITESFVYDDLKYGVGKLSRATGPNSSLAYAYDSLSRPVEKNEVLLGKTFMSQIKYDALNRISRSVYPGGFAVNYSYDEVSQLTQIKDDRSGRAFWSLDALYPTGDVKQYHMGNGTTGFKAIDTRNGLVKAESIVASDNRLQMSRTYQHDSVGNLISRADNTTSNSESFTYDALNRLESFTGAGLKPVTISYDQLSRITGRSDVGSYEYGKGCESGLGSPFTLKKAGSKTFCTDARGNMVKSGNQTISYDANNLPIVINDENNSVKYQYGLGRQILSKEENVGGEKITTRYASGNFEEEESSHGVKDRFYVADFLVVEMDGLDYQEHYLYRDYLGSVLASADQTGSVIERLDYDPFGQRRNTSDLTWLDGFRPKTTSRGFTGQDHIESMNLIHMGGRVYDPTVGLFMSPDPYVQDPSMIQNLNRYSYVLNNPLSYTDPTGHFFEHVFRQIDRGLTSAVRAIANPGRFLNDTWNKVSRAASDPRYQRLAASVAVSVLATIYQPQWAAESWKQSAAYFAAVGATSSYVSTNGDGKAALSGALTGAAFNLVGSAFEIAKDANGALSSGMMAAKVAAHGVVGGLSAVANGGRFESGFLSSGLSEFAGQNGFYGSESGKGWEIASGAARAAVVGGSISQLSGGSFESGALNAAMGRLFNAAAHAGPFAVALEDFGMAVRGFVTSAGEWIGAAGRAGTVGFVGWAVLHSDEIGQEDAPNIGTSSDKPIPGNIVTGEGINKTDPNTWPEPPAEGPFTVGEPSRSKPQSRGEKSLFDPQGGEWRPHVPDKNHEIGHWDYKPAGKNSGWKNVF